MSIHSRKCRRCSTKMILRRKIADPYYECPWCFKIEYLYPAEPITRNIEDNDWGAEMADRKDIVYKAGVYQKRGR